jgi:hypothetical protein
MNRDRVETLVIGAGQAGLAVGYYLRRRGLPFVIVDEHQRVGDVWRKRWDSLRLFTPGRYNGLPGMPFPGPPSAFPTKDDIAEYFETYAREFGLPVRTGLRVERLSAVNGRFEAFCGEQVLSAENVVLATKHGFPIQDRGIVESVPGLYFMGLLFQYSLSSALVGGAGRDAEYIVDHIASNRRGRCEARRDPRGPDASILCAGATASSKPATFSSRKGSLGRRAH